MIFNIEVTDPAKIAGLQRALAQYNSLNEPKTQEVFMQWLVDGQLSEYARTLVVSAIPPFDFLSRFTPAERAIIRTAGKSDATIADYIAMIDAAPMVNLTSELTTTGVQSLEAAGLIAAGRAAEILAL